MDLGVILPQSRIDEMVASGAWPDRILLDYLDDAVAMGPDLPAITTYNGELGGEPYQLSYGELDKLSRRFALALLDMGVASGDVVALQLPNWWQCSVLHLACTRVGSICNILMPIFRERELAFMLDFAEAKILVAPERFRGFDYRAMIESLHPGLPHLREVSYIGGLGADGFEAKFMTPAREQAADASGRLAARRPGPNDVNELAYTSGTTGEPKGVMNIPNTTLGHLVQWNAHHKMTSEDIIFMASPLAHRTGFIYGLAWPILAGCQVVLLDRWDPPVACEIIEKHRCTFTMGATPFLADIVNMPNVERFDLSSLRTFVSAGAPIPPALVQRAAENFSFKVLSGWGMSECACPAICSPDDPPEKVWSSDGKCMAGNEVIIHDDDGKPVPHGEEGHLKFRGASMFVGYLKRPELMQTDAEGWFETGDLAHLDANGYIRITGRAKDIIIRGGENIPVVEVEQMLYKHPAILQCAVIGVPDERLGERGGAYVVLREGQSFSFEDMLAWLDENGTAKPYWPEILRVVAELPQTPSGKIQKFKLREMLAESNSRMELLKP